MRRYSLVLLAGLLLLAACSPAAPQQSFPGDWQAFDAYAAALIGREMERYKLVGVSAAVVDGDRIVWARGFGWADAAGGVPATPATVYRAGSVSKLLNAAAAMQLCDEGKLDLDKPVAAYLPDFSLRSRFPAAPPVTLRHLLTHHAGLPSDIVGGMWGDDPPPFTAIVALLKEEYAAYPPGYIAAYSNAGSCLAGVAVERAAGEAYAGYLDRRLLAPLGMTHSSFAPRPAVMSRLAKGYDKDGRERADVGIRDVPAGGLYTSVADLGRFLAMLFNEGESGGQRILSPAAVRELLREQPASPLDGTFRIGLEFFLEYPELAYAGKIAGHGGETFLFRCHVLTAPDHKLGVVVMTNSAGARSKDAVVGLMKAAIAVKTGLTPADGTAVKAPPPPGTPAAAPGGFYGTVAGLAKVKPGARPELAVRGWRFRLTPGEDGWQTPELLLGGVAPVPLSLFGKDMAVAFRTVNGEEVVFLRDGAKVSTAGMRCAPSPIPSSWLRYAGGYELVGDQNLQLKLDAFRVFVEDGFLTVELAAEGESGRFVLLPVADNEAVLYGLGRRMMETMTAAGVPGEERLHFAGLEFRKVQAQEFLPDL
ncbi:MAG: serine hydrolase domain-containing protein [Sporomusaceae bacterium]|nr:serine hydrolase domain-containing protein [Sporomusaceae bacterium]